MIDLAVIGGTSFSSFENLDDLEQVFVETTYGDPSSTVTIGKLHGLKVAFINRHGSAGSIPPHKVNYRANIAALANLGADKVVALNAVGGIADYAEPAHISIPNQVIDYSYGREHTYYDGSDGTLDFVDFTEPFSESLRQELIAAALELKLDQTSAGFSTDSCYACTQGPRLESAAEIRRLAKDGCDLVGMTLMPEVALAREKGLDYASICLSVNWAAGLSEQSISMDDIHKVVEEGGSLLESILLGYIENQSR